MRRLAVKRREALQRRAQPARPAAAARPASHPGPVGPISPRAPRVGERLARASARARRSRSRRAACAAAAIPASARRSRHRQSESTPPPVRHLPASLPTARHACRAEPTRLALAAVNPIEVERVRQRLVAAGGGYEIVAHLARPRGRRVRPRRAGAGPPERACRRRGVRRPRRRRRTLTVEGETARAARGPGGVRPGRRRPPLHRLRGLSVLVIFTRPALSARGYWCPATPCGTYGSSSEATSSSDSRSSSAASASSTCCELRRADDRRGHARLAEHPRERDLRARHAARLGDRLHALDHRHVELRARRASPRTGRSARASSGARVPPPRLPARMPRASGLHGSRPTPSSMHCGIISRSSSR